MILDYMPLMIMIVVGLVFGVVAGIRAETVDRFRR